MADQTTETEMVPSKTPLPDVEAQQLSMEEEDEETKKKRQVERTLWTRIWQGTAIACIVLNLVAIGIETSVVCFIAGLVAMVVSAAVYVFQRELQDTDSLRFVQNELRRLVNKFAVINDGLTKNVDRLSTEVSGLKETEAKLDKIATDQGTSLNKLKELIKESQVIIEEKNKLLKADVMQAMMEIVLLEDRDESWEFSDKEINRLIMRMKNLPAIKVNEDKLRAQVQKQRSFYSVIGLLQDINDETIAEEDHIFVVNEEEYELQESE